MKKPTTLKRLLFVLALLFNFASYAQNDIAFNSKFNLGAKENLFLKASNQLNYELSYAGIDTLTKKVAVPIIPHPVKRYAEGDYAGTVSICPNDGAELPKLFLCGLNDSRLIETGITNATSITWMRRTGGCTPNANGNCANTAENCTWAGVATGPNYTANAAGEFKVVITYADATVFTFYFNVYKNEVDPTGITKSDIVAGNNCTIPARITAGGFGSAYEYSFTTNPAANTWQDSNTFYTSTADSYNVFIRLKNVPSSCIFNVKNIVVNRIDFSTTLTATQPGCAGDKGKIKVTGNTQNNEYIYAIYAGTNTNTTALNTTQPLSVSEYEFTGLDAGTYTVVTTVKRTGTATCDVSDSKRITITAASTLNNTSYISTPFSACTPGIIQGRANGGTGSPYRYFVNYNNTGFVDVPNGRVIVDKGGTYIMRVEDLNGCKVDQTFSIGNVTKPVYTINTTTSGNCNPTGTITVNVTNNNGYNTINYSKDNGTNWQSGNSFTNLPSGDYNITIRYRTGNNGSYCQDAFTTVTIGTTTPLTASAGVAALPGCQPYPDRGIVRITNPQGGTAPYEYYFSNEAVNHNGWSTYNEGYLPAGGPYTVRIRDAKGCTYDMTGIVIDSKPSAPKIEYGPISYNCDGTATQTVIINNGAGDPRYNFQYYLDGNPNPNTANPNVFLNVPAGSHIISVDYNIKSVSTYSNLLTETFGSGENTTSPGINTFYYCFERQLANQPSTWCNGAYAINDGDYSVTSSINQAATNGWNWRYPVDHTSGGSDPKGRFLAVNIGDQIPVTTILYEKQINDVIPNQPIMFEFYAMNLMMPGAGKADPNLRIALVDASGTEISWFATGNVPRSSSNTDWKKYPQTAITLDPGNNTTLRLIVRSNVQATEGNDVAIDDIKVFQVPRVCGAQFSEPFTITPPPPFAAHVDRITPVSCFGAGDGKFDIYAENFDGEFFYTLNNGGTWIRSTVDRVTVGPLAPATYNVKVRNHMSSTACDFDIPTVISSPARFTLDATATVATCNTPSVVEAIIGGGTGPYNISLTRISDGVVFPFVLEATDNKYRVRDNNLTPGVYSVTGLDNNNCSASKSTNLTITGSTPPTARIESTSNLCFTQGAGATIVISITNGVGPFSYRVRRNSGNYSDFSTASSSRTITHNVTADGFYEFEIMDFNGCRTQAVSQQIDPQLGARTQVRTSLSCKATGSDATIEVTISGGTAPYNYIVKSSLGNQVASGNTTNPVFEYSTGIADTYTFEITDTNNCFLSVNGRIDALVRPTAQSTPHNATCNGGTGSVDLQGLTGKAPFKFQFNGIGGFTDETHYENLPTSVAGTDYTFIVRDDNDCERSYSFKLFAPEVISGTATISPVYNCDHPATITVSNVAGGTPQYRYTLLRDGAAVAGPQDGNTFTGINVAGAYTVRITDANSCSVVVNAGTVNAMNPPAAMTITTTTAATCPNNRGSVTITNVTNAAGVALTGTLEYRIVLPTATSFQSSNVFDNLDANVQYTFEVRDANMCTYRKIHTIALPSSFTVGGSGGNVTCFGASDGTATFTVAGIANGTNYSYVVDSRAAVTGTSTGNSFTISVTGLTAGNHTITVTNSTTNCPISASVTVDGPTAALALNAPTLTHETCIVKGTAVINAVNGWGTYTYTVTPTSPAGTPIVQVGNNTFNNLDAGTYSVTVTDNGGCTTPVAQNFTINPSVDPTASIDTANSDLCASGTGATIRVTPNAATNYTYSIDSRTAQTTGTFTGVAPGNHTIRVTDTSTGCHIDLTVPTIAQPISATPSIGKELDCTTTTPTSANATINVEIFNGYPDFKYRVNQTGAPFSGAFTDVTAGTRTFTYSAATAGTYYFEITDANDCTTVISQVVNPIVKPTFNASQNNVLCRGEATGSITITGNPATGTYEYSINNGGTFQSSNTFGGLLAGPYQVVVRDSKNCVSDPQTITITEPVNGLDATATVTQPLTCGPGNASQAATITVTVTGGTPFAGVNPYRYSYNGQAPVTSNTYTINTAGNVTVVVTDANNCSFTVVGGVTIDVLDPPAGLTITPSRTITCTALDTDLTLAFTGGVGPFTYEITSPTASAVSVNDANRNHTFNNLAPGHYFFKVTDHNNCTVTGDYEVQPVTPITVGSSLVTAVTCNNSSTGAIKFTVGGNSTGFTYVVRNTANTVITGGVVTGNDVDFTGLPGGTTYTITVTNPSTGCTATASIALANPAAVTITAASGTKVFCNKPDTVITVTASGGTGTLYYAVVRAGAAAPTYPADYNTTGVFTRSTTLPTAGLSFDVYVRDNNGCPATRTISITRDNAPRIDPVVAAQCYSGTNFTVNITGSVYNGIANATFGLNGVYNTNPAKTITGAGIYTLGIKDDNGCEDTTTIEVNDQLTITALLQKDLTCPTVPPTPTDAQINLSALGGDGTYTYEYRVEPSLTFNPIVGNIFYPSTQGEYYFRVTSDGCSAVTTQKVDVTDPVLPVITGVTEVQSIKCNGDETAAISIAIDNSQGVAPFVFNVRRTAPTIFDYGTQTTGLAAGTYTITVTDAKGCVDTETINISQPLPINFTLEKVDITCNNPGGSSLGQVNVRTVSGGTAPFTYYITNNFGDVILGNPYAATAREDHDFTVIKYGIYTVNIVDANGCNLSRQITIASPPEDLTINVGISPSDCLTGGSAKVSVVAPVGSHNYRFGILETNTAPYTTTWYTSDPGFPDERTFITLIPGVTYTFVVHDLTTDCYYVKAADAPIQAASPMKSDVTAHNVTCRGAGDGSVTFSLRDFDASTTSVDYAIFRAFSNVQVYPAAGTLNTVVPMAAPGSITVPSPGALLPGTYYIQFRENGTGSYNGCRSASDTFEIKESSVDLSVSAQVLKNENCDELGTIIAEAKDGAGTYSYLASTSAAMPSLTDPAWQTSGTFPLAAGTYYIFAKDANNCIKTAVAPISLVRDPDPVFSLAVANLCAAEGAFEVNVTITDATPTMAPYYVSVNNASFVSVTGLTYTASGLNSGLHRIRIKNKNGCIEERTITINATPVAIADVDKILDCSGAGNAVADASIIVNIQKGVGPFTYTVEKDGASFGTPVTLGLGVTSFTYPVTNANAGSYIFTITDPNSCSTTTTEVTIDALVPIVPTFTPTEPLCIGGTGTILLGATGGKGAYTYTLERTAPTAGTVISQSVPLFENLIAGTYTYTIQDELGCIVTGSDILDEPSEVFADAPIITPFRCGPGNLGQSATVVLGATGGVGNYEFSFNNSPFTTETTYTVIDTNVDHLAIPYSVRDANQCTKSGTIDIFKLDPPTAFDINAANVITCATGLTTVTISNVRNSAGAIAVPPAVLTYQIISPTSAAIDNGTNPSFTNLGPGNYVFQVTDAAGCVKQLSYEIEDVTRINIVEQSTTPITCFGTDDGQASFLVTGFGTGVGTYNYTLDGVTVTGQTASIINLTGLTPGNHSISVFDDETECSLGITFNIAAPPAALVIDKTVTPLGCTTFGAVTITAQDGWEDYTFRLTLPNSSVLTNKNGLFEGLTLTGTYNIRVTDANGCVANDSFQLSTPVNPTATVDASSVYCNSAAGATLVINAASTSPFILPGDTYQYSINNGGTWSTNNTFANLNAGTYNIKVKDKFGCESTAFAEIINAELFASAKKDKDIFCAPAASVNGLIKVEAVGGYPPYSYTVTKNGILDPTVIPFPTPTATVADYVVTEPGGAGTYIFTITDSRTCSDVTEAVEMVDPTPVTYTAVPTSPSCSGSQGNVGNGSILITLNNTNDNPPYTYTIQRTAPTAGPLVSQNNNPLFTGLIAGTYDVNVISARGCETPDTVTINEPDPVFAQVTASPFTCSATNTINETIVTVRGGHGTVVGPVGDFTYSNNGTNWFTSNTFKVFNDPAPQHLTYWVKDAKGCISSNTIDVDPFPTLVSAEADLAVAADCPNGGIETIQVDIVGGTGDFEYQVSVDNLGFGAKTAFTGQTFTYPGPAGHSYQFLITDVNTTCTILTNVHEVPLYNVMKVNATASAMASCQGFTNGSITINIENYTGTYDYRVLLAGAPVATGTGINAATNNPYVITGLGAGVNYEVEVTQLGYPQCVVLSNPVTITEPPVLDISGMQVAVENQNCKNLKATITVDPTTIVGGTREYMYAFVPAGTTPDPVLDYQTSNIKTFTTTQITPLFDSYDVYVRDANMCVQMTTVNISLDPMPVIDNVSVASQCASAAGYRIDVAATGLAPLKYSLDGVQFQDDAFFTVFNPGNYTVTVMDKNQCTVTATAPLTILEPLTLDAEVTLLPLCNTASGTITLTAAGGTVTPANSYRYTINNWATDQVSNVFNNLAPGTYTFGVEDIVTRCRQTVTIEIETPTDVLGVTLTARPVTCNGGSNGGVSVAIAATNDNPPYTYSISGATVSIVDQVSPDFNNLPAGLYTVVVKSGRGCESLPQTIEVTEPAQILVYTSFTEYGCTTGNTTNNATITVDSVTGGSNNYVRYEFRRGTELMYSGTSNTYTEVDHAGGTYTVTVYDNNNCQGTNTTPIEIRPFASLIGMTFNVTPITCVTGETIETVVDVRGTLTAPLQYTLTGTDANGNAIAPVVNNDGRFTGLAIGNYLVTVFNPATNCSIVQNHQVIDPNTFSFTVTGSRQDVCFGDSDGSVDLTLVDNRPIPNDEAGAFTYTITGPVSSSGTSTGATLPLTGLSGGRYEVVAVLVGSPYCEVRTTFDIGTPSTELTMNLSSTPVTCADGNNDGTIDVYAEGGWAGTYQYELVGPVSYAYSEVGFFESLTPGHYVVNVKDSKNCIITRELDLVIPDPIQFNASATSNVLTCYGDDSGVITVGAPTGGQGSNYSYTLNYTNEQGETSILGPQTSNVFTGLRAGTYTVTVTDGFSCEATSPTTITLTNPSEVVPVLSLETGLKCQASATLTLTVTGGTAPYTYSEDGINDLGSFNSSVTFPVTIGDHQYFVKDNLGCLSVVSNNISVPALEPLTISLEGSNTHVNCKYDSSAIINAVAKGGLGNYQYSLIDTSNNTEVRPAQADGLFTDLAAGVYRVHVVSDDCETDEIVTITEADEALNSTPTVTPVSCFGEKTGAIVISASGGTGVIKYAISPYLDQFVESGTFERLEAGQYTVIVQDILGCVVIHTINITQPDILIANEIPGSIIPEICKGDNDGAFSIQVRGGTAPYYESLDKSDGPFNLINGTEKDYTGLAGGTHSVFIRDSNNCITEVEINMPEPVVLNPTAEVTYDCVNNAQANMVVVTVDPSNNPTDVDYSLDNNGTYQPSNIFTNVPAGDHFIVARHTNGCEVPTVIFKVDPVAELSLINVTNQSKEINILEVRASGGFAPYEYSFNGEPFSSSNTYRIYKSGIYKVIVRDKNGCEATIDIEGIFYDFCMPNYFTPNGDGQNDTIGPDCGALAYKELTFDIYDRYGRVVAEYRVGGKWDGRYHGNELPTGDYWYVLKLNDPKDPREFVGHFTLYR